MLPLTTEIDEQFCGELIAKVGAGLREKSRGASHSAALADLYGRFAAANDWAGGSIRSALQEQYPHIAWSGAEFDVAKQKGPEYPGPYWVCDPIDGAVQYLQDIPFWTISLTLIDNGRAAHSFIFDPSHQELFHAVAGQGAFLNGVPLKVGAKKELRSAIVATAHPSLVTKDPVATTWTSQAAAHLLPQVFALRIFGAVSLQLAYVACGRLDGYWEFGNDMYDWLGGALLIREAGGVVTDLSGQELAWGGQGIVAANGDLQSVLQTALPRVQQ